MKDNYKTGEQLALVFEDDMKILTEKYLDYLPDGVNKEVFARVLILSLSVQ